MAVAAVQGSILVWSTPFSVLFCEFLNLLAWAVHEAKELRDTEMLGKQDPYVKVNIAKEVHCFS